MIEHIDTLDSLNKHAPIKDKLVSAHMTIKKSLPFIARIAIALYDPETRVLKTFLHSSEDDNPLENYQALIDDAPSLKKILDKGLPRVINNMLTFDDGSKEHTRRIGRVGYAASYTMPMFNDGDFLGFVFFIAKHLKEFGCLLSVLNLFPVFRIVVSLNRFTFFPFFRECILFWNVMY